MVVKNKTLRFFNQKLEILTSRNVYKDIIPSLERYSFRSDTLCIVNNIPSKEALKKAKNSYDHKTWKEFKMTININGWLSKSRGIGIILEICDRLKGDGVGFVMAGKLDCEEAVLLSQKDNVHYIGQVSNEEALATYFTSDFVFTYYDPSSEINRYAASNKWGDALKTGVAIIVNKEVVSAKKLIEKKVAIGFNYDDTEGLISEIKHLSSNREQITTIKNSAFELGKNLPYFDDNIKKIFSLS